MCGIAGWVSFDRDLTKERGTLETMTKTMSCRGPDAEGIWLDRQAAIGHRRLSVIDLDGGKQPMVVDTAEGAVAMTYSGEAYNFTELRDELRRRGHLFRTASDTEVVLHGYLEWGEAVAERLNGMYAFAIWDARTKKLIMIRDHMGIKPFYFYPTADGVLFGSEPKAILANPLAKRVVGIDGLREVFSLCKPPGHAIWAGMREVEPGTVVTVDRNGLRTHTYWKLETKQHSDDTETTVGKVRELLNDIVCRQLVADVPHCVLLSGGLDSSTITALAAQQLAEQGERVRSFSVDFPYQAENFVPDEFWCSPDTPYIHDVRDHVGSAHQDIVLDHTALADPEVRRAAVAARDLPVGLGDMDASLYLMFKAIRQQSTVALSGEAGDEVFGGYKWCHDPVAQQSDTFPWLITLSVTREINALMDPSLLSALDIRGYLADEYASAVAEVDGLEGESDLERRMRRINYLNLTRYLRVMLDRKDRMSMAVGLEVRVPYCDHRLVEYVYNTPWSMKTFDGREKSLLRGAARDVLPKSVVERMKNPYPSIQDRYYVGALQQQVKELLVEHDNPVLDLMNRSSLAEVVGLDPTAVSVGTRQGLERILDVAVWFDIHRPELRL